MLKLKDIAASLSIYRLYSSGAVALKVCVEFSK